MPDLALTYMCRDEVIRAASTVDPLLVVERALQLHADGQTTLPEEAYLPWRTSDGRFARSLALPGAAWGARSAIGLKVINSSLGNVERGLRRAHGLTLLFDQETARPYAILEAEHLSTLRTAAYTAVSVAHLANRPVRRVGIIGCGSIGLAHVDLISAMEPDAAFVMFDQDLTRAEQARAQLGSCSVSAVTVPTARTAVEGADVVVTATTTTHGYIPHDWIEPGALVAHVSLDDLLPDAVARADLVFVDDWNLVRDDARRLLGRMYRSGDLLAPGTGPTGPVQGRPRSVDGTLADVISGRHPGREDARAVIVSNPFGMGILDVALAAEVEEAARALGLGTELER